MNWLSNDILNMIGTLFLGIIASLIATIIYDKCKKLPQYTTLIGSINWIKNIFKHPRPYRNKEDFFRRASNFEEKIYHALDKRPPLHYPNNDATIFSNLAIINDLLEIKYNYKKKPQYCIDIIVDKYRLNNRTNIDCRGIGTIFAECVKLVVNQDSIFMKMYNANKIDNSANSEIRNKFLKTLNEQIQGIENSNK